MHSVVVVCVRLFCDPVNCSPPGSSLHGILEWVAIAFFRGSFQPRDWACISCIGRWILYHWATREALLVICSYPKSGQAEDQMCLCLIGGVCHTTEAKGVCTLIFISDYEWKVLHPMKEISVTSDWLYEVYFGWSGPSCPWSITQ